MRPLLGDEIKQSVGTLDLSLACARETTEAYHADRTAESHSTLEVFRRSVPEYYARYVTQTVRHPEPTAEMRLGSALDAILFEPELDLVCEAPEVDRRTKAGREAWATFLDESAGKIVVESGAGEKLRVMRESVMANRSARLLLEASGGRPQESIRWQDRLTGIQLKARFDWLIRSVEVAVDLKTASDPRPGPWSSKANNFGYHRQAALYLAGIEALEGRPFEMFHIVVGNTWPHECVVYQFGIEDLQLGGRLVHSTLRRLAECRASNDWRGALADRVQPIALPRYAHYEE